MPDVVFATFLADGMLFGIEVGTVQEVLRDQYVEPVPRAPQGIVGVINLRGRILAVTDVRTRMGLPPTEHEGHAFFIVHGTDGLEVLLVDSESEVIAVDPDDALLVPDTTPAPIARLLRNAFQVEGRLLLVVDLDRMFDTAMGGDAP